MHHGQHHRLQIQTFLGEHVFESTGSCQPLFEDAFANEAIEACAEDVAGDPEILAEVVKSLPAKKSLSQDQQRPAFAHDLQRQCQRAVHGVEGFQLHGGAA